MLEMRKKILNRKINNPPGKPVLIWDGNCGFCHYWILRVEKIIGDAIDYEPYQKAEKYITEITEKEFSEAVKFIDTDGNVYSGAAAFFKALSFKKNGSMAFPLYLKSSLFRKISDFVYKTISGHRPLAYKATVALW